MRNTCENCRTVYEAVGTDPTWSVCPYCEHANRLRAEAETPPPDPATEIPAEHDPLKTMLVPMASEPHDPRDPALDPAGETLRTRMELTVVVEGKPVERHAITEPRVTIGRGLCDIRVHDPGISREHFSIEVLDGVPVLKDLGSANGTLLNGQFMTEHVLVDGDEIEVGSTLLRFHLPTGQ